MVPEMKNDKRSSETCTDGYGWDLQENFVYLAASVFINFNFCKKVQNFKFFKPSSDTRLRSNPCTERNSANTEKESRI